MKLILFFSFLFATTFISLDTQAQTCVVKCRTPFNLDGDTLWGPAFFTVTQGYDGDLSTSGIINEPCKCKGWATDVPVISCANPASNAYYQGYQFEYLSCPYNAHQTSEQLMRMPACQSEFNRIVNQGGSCNSAAY